MGSRVKNHVDMNQKRNDEVINLLVVVVVDE